MSDLSMQIFLGNGEPDITLNDTLTSVSLAELAESPMLDKLTRKQRRLWEAQLRDLGVQLRMLDLRKKGGEE